MPSPKPSPAHAAAHGRLFMVTLRTDNDATTIRDLRWVLKALLRQHRLRCVDIAEINETVDEA